MGRRTYVISIAYYGQLVEKVPKEKDLRIVFTKELKVAENCNEAYSKANRMLGLISRTIKYKNPVTLLNLYKSSVRPHLDYCSVVWNTHYLKDIHLLERVQHRFTRLFPDLRSLPYKERLNKLGLWSVEERRNRADLIEVFKMIKVCHSMVTFFSRRQGTRPHKDSWKFVKNYCHSDIRRHFLLTTSHKQMEQLMHYRSTRFRTIFREDTTERWTSL